MTSDLVKWRRIGINNSNSNDVIERKEFNEIMVSWLDNVPDMCFSKDDYKSLEIIYGKKE
ncbi:hypothetical protein [Paenibacillus terrigena]|uniref:hypothetical protein n=1 Tax=Paenibacillus terrigena TaxID=369333 RepID=UPI0012EBF74D|nr:hypothetical protein [Paenibacillus terrigena]